MGDRAKKSGLGYEVEKKMELVRGVALTSLVSTHFFVSENMGHYFHTNIGDRNYTYDIKITLFFTSYFLYLHFPNPKSTCVVLFQHHSKT